MTKFLGAGGASAIMATALLALGGSGQAFAQQITTAASNIPLVKAAVTATNASLPAVPAIATVAPRVAAPLSQIAPPIMSRQLPSIFQGAAPAAAVAPSLSSLVSAQIAGAPLDEEGKCLATAVYFESMGEPLQGQLAVANVVINRARSGRYPSSFCAVVKQKAQFSFVRAGRFPRIDPACQAWAKAQAIARIASQNLAQALPSDVLWYHADYVAPGWGRRLTRIDKIGAHIFYRS
ncbi:cell wall hydrolase [Sphingomonas sp. LY29]|uniref:cell wall hydrolase n=1 Tax=Sphingomonas sp. LY29 TaxID=3095341 RepID=UPI002D78C42C|nr:cell wall hydrolase [Sphingomonas sp. LY29]WRP26581.1 cell wall hydrolase [Sphingomonas sp. LY29]